MTNASHDSPTAAVELRGLAKAFHGPTGTVQAVDSLDLVIGDGEILALLGPNGSGKSTTIDMLLGLTEPDAGTVAVLGRRPAEAIAAGDVGVMLQTGGLIRDLSVRELVAMGGSLYPAPLHVDELLRLVGAKFEGRSSLRSWLYTIATNACLRAIERRPKRVLPIDYGPAADPHDGHSPATGPRF